MLEGTFSDESGDYPAGSYVRNPPGSGHSPYSDDGCRILVKLRQFDAQDLTPIVIDTCDSKLWQSHESADILPLYQFGSEQVAMMRIAADQKHTFGDDSSGVEIFVVGGTVRYEDEDLPAESWLRFPAGEFADLLAISDIVLWVKLGHLPVND